MKTKVLILDHNDSFTWNLAQAIYDTGMATADVLPSEAADLPALIPYTHIILSPGPGLPQDFPFLNKLLISKPSQAILGVCLGHQAIAQYYGAQLHNLQGVRHGMRVKVKPLKELGLFAGLMDGFEAGLYHSWVVANTSMPACLEITAIDEQGKIMALRHLEHDIQGVQFHPESYMTPSGISILRNWIRSTR